MCSCRGDEEEAREPERLDQHLHEGISKNISKGIKINADIREIPNSRSALLFIRGKNPR